MVDLGKDAGVATSALLTDMNVPLGLAIGNAQRGARVGRGARRRRPGRHPSSSRSRSPARCSRSRASPTPTSRPPSTTAGPWTPGATMIRAQGGDPDAALPVARETHVVTADARRRARPSRRRCPSASPPGASAPAARASRTRCSTPRASTCTRSPATPSSRGSRSSRCPPTSRPASRARSRPLEGAWTHRRRARRARPAGRRPHLLTGRADPQRRDAGRLVALSHERTGQGLPPACGGPRIAPLPKVSLHDHLDGGLRPATIVELADEIGSSCPRRTPTAWRRWFVDRPTPAPSSTT